MNYYESPYHVIHEKEKADEMAMKADMTILIAKAIDRKGWSKSSAAKLLGVDKAVIDDIYNHRFANLDIDELFKIHIGLSFI